MNIPPPGLQSLEPHQVAAWLRANGWELVETRPEHTATWSKGSGSDGPFILDLPLNVNFRDYSRRMGELVDTLSVSSAKPASWVLAELRASTYDVIRLRSTGPGVGNGRVPVELGARLFGLTRDLLLAAACSAYEPRPVYRTRKPSEAMEFLRRVKLAATEEGSFVVTVHAPVPPGLVGVPQVEEEVPFERRATAKLATAISAARRAAEQAGLGGGAQPFLDEMAQGVSANVCDALAGFVEGDEATGLDVHVAWAASRSISGGMPFSIHVGTELCALLREGARVLRSTGSTPDFDLEGAVVRLDSSNPDAGGIAVIAGQVDGQPRKVRVRMAPADYGLAIHAHRQGLLLRCEGELVRQGRQFQLEQVRQVRSVVDED